MGYVKAEDILPAELIEQIQQYTDGANIYIPRKPEHRSGWGEKNKTKKKLLLRDTMIYQDYQAGIRVPELAKKYYLSEKSIWRIVRKMRT